MTTKLNWRLSKLPTVEELLKLVNDKIITQEEAKEILFSNKTEEDRDKDSLEQEIKFLRELVTKLSNNQATKIIETIREVQKPWQTYPWYQPYYYWTTNTGGASGTMYYTNGSATTTANVTNLAGSTGVSQNFNDIKTF